MSATLGLYRRYLADLVFGANDGIITTLAVISGVVGVSLSTRVILILGFANLLKRAGVTDFAEAAAVATVATVGLANAPHRRNLSQRCRLSRWQ